MKKIICIGDSIRMGYEPTVVTELEGWAVLGRAVARCNPGGGLVSGGPVQSVASPMQP